MNFKERQLNDYLKKEGWEKDPSDDYPFRDPKKNQALVSDILKYRLQDRGQQLTPEIQSKFLQRFQPAFDYGTGDGLVYDTKHKQFQNITHEGDIENILPGVKKEDWWKDTGIDRLQMKQQPWYKKILG